MLTGRRFYETAKILYEAGYRKGETVSYQAMVNAQNADRWQDGYEQGKTETAAKIAERLKEKCRELQSKYSHLCKSKAEAIQETCRYEGVTAVKNSINEICKEFTEGGGK